MVSMRSNCSSVPNSYSTWVSDSFVFRAVRSMAIRSVPTFHEIFVARFRYLSLPVRDVIGGRVCLLIRRSGILLIVAVLGEFVLEQRNVLGALAAGPEADPSLGHVRAHIETLHRDIGTVVVLDRVFVKEDVLSDTRDFVTTETLRTVEPLCFAQVTNKRVYVVSLTNTFVGRL